MTDDLQINSISTRYLLSLNHYSGNQPWCEAWVASCLIVQVERLLLRGEILTRIKEAIANLPPAQRVVVTLRDVEGLEPQETCNILQISETNQRVLLHRARSALRRTLEQYLRRK